jgi:hypothetical protein
MSDTRESRIRKARVIDDFLKNDVIADVLSKLERADYEAFLKATNSEERARAQGQALAHRNFEVALKALLDSGEREMIQIAKEVKKESQKRRT